MTDDGDDSAAPIACSLSATEWDNRIAEWQFFFQTAVTSLESAPASSRFALVSSDEALLAAASLSQLEKECCPFFEFSIEIGADSRWLVVRVPEAAQDSLSNFMTMLQAT